MCVNTARIQLSVGSELQNRIQVSVGMSYSQDIGECWYELQPGYR